MIHMRLAPALNVTPCEKQHKRGEMAERRAEAVIDGVSFTSSYITVDTSQKWNLLLIDIHCQHLTIPQEGT